KRFCSSDTYHFALKEDFQFALSCVDFYWTEDTEDELKQRKQNFNTNFLDKYEYGASFLTVSY
ncbi:hypothetical protein, partial [Fulvivirga kasyanovii]